MPSETTPVPFKGVSDGMPFVEQPRQVTDPDGLLNVVFKDDGTGRNVLATRPGVAPESNILANTGQVQCISSIPRASGFTTTGVEKIVSSTLGTSRPAGQIRGNCLVLAPDWSVRAVFSDARGTGTSVSAPPVGQGGYGAFGVRWHATDPDIGYFLTIARNSTINPQDRIVSGLNRVSLATSTITHQTWIVDAAPGYSTPLPADPPGPVVLDILPNQMAQIGPYLFVAVDRYVYTFNADDLTYIQRTFIDWALEVQGIAAITRGGINYLLVLATGTTTIRGPVVADTGPDPKEVFGEFYGAHIQLHRIQHTYEPFKTPVTVGGTPLLRLAMPMGLPTTDPGYENHVTFRFSEWSVCRPRGCLPFAIAAEVDVDNNVFAYVARTNQGWGYDGSIATHRPDGTGQYVSACRINLTRAFEDSPPAYMNPALPVRYGMSADVGGWERDTGSLRRAYPWGTNTYANDIPKLVGGLRNPQETDNEPTFWSVLFAKEEGLVYFAGRRPRLTGAADNIGCFDAATGILIWEADTKGTIQQNSLARDPISGNVVATMIRSDGWTTADGDISGAKAEVLEFDKATGIVVRSFDLTDAINLNGNITAGTSIGSFGVDVNSRGEVLVALAPYRYDV